MTETTEMTLMLAPSVTAFVRVVGDVRPMHLERLNQHLDITRAALTDDTPPAAPAAPMSED